MATIKHAFIVDGDAPFDVVCSALNQAIDDLERHYGLTITIKDVTIDRNPHGRGMWEYTIKVNKNVE